MSTGDIENAGCILEGTAFLPKYFSGKAQKKEIISFWNCASKSLKNFIKNARGKSTNIYRVTELKQFLEQFFLNGKKFPDDLTEELMVLKASTLGGNTKILTKNEINQILKLIHLIKVHSVSLNKFLPLNTDALSTLKKGELNKAINQIQKTADAFGGFFQASASDYPFENFTSLLRAIESFYEMPANENAINEVVGLMPILKKLKTTLVGPNITGMGKGEWQNLYTFGSKWLGVLLRVYYISKNHPSWPNKDALENIETITEELNYLFVEAINFHPKRVITFEEIYSLIDEIDSKYFKPATPATVKKVIKGIVMRGLGGKEFNETGRNAPGLTIPAVTRSWKMVERWLTGQNYLAGIFEILDNSKNKKTKSYTPRELLSIKPEKALGTEKLTEAQKNVVSDLREVINKYPGFVQDSSGEIYFDIQNTKKHTFYNLSQINLFRQILRLVMQGYSKPDEFDTLYTRGVSIDSFKVLFGDIQTLLEEINLVDRDKKNQDIQRYYEATLFTYSANGDAYVNLDEANQYMVYLFSVYYHRSRFHDLIADRCPTGENGIFGRPKIEPVCYRKELVNNYALIFNQMPNMKAFYKKIIRDGRVEEFHKKLENAARFCGYSDINYTEFVDTHSFAATFQYVESLFARFDKDGSQTINVKEAQAAFPLFSEFLRTLTDELSTYDEFEALFTYMLRYGTPPQDALLDKVHFWFWMQSKRWWDFEVDRENVVMIFATLNMLSRDENGDTSGRCN